ncbi:MAG: DUF393 domain-containing protein [Lentisphaeria bacterium]|nr:DUF393 domain-containing protein [Lentisphaeria bacterium]
MKPEKPTIFYDSLCPICLKEISFLQRKDIEKKVDYIDITDPEFKPEKYGFTIEDCIGQICGIRTSGKRIMGLEVFRMVYSEIGYGYLMNWTGWPIMRFFADIGYRIFAKIRPKFSKFSPSCENGRCKI